MDFLDFFLGQDRRGGDGISDLIGRFTKSIVGCGCIVVLVLVAFVVLAIQGTIRISDDAFTTIVVLITIGFAVISLIRASTGR